MNSHFYRKLLLGSGSAAIFTLSGVNAAAQTVFVSDVDELYSAVNYPSNVGAAIALSPGVNNHFTIEIHGEGKDNGRWQPVEFFTDSIPADPNTTNSVTVPR
jgi:hypothetical protein